MSSRALLILGLFGLAAITGGIVWLTQVQSKESATVTTSASDKHEPAPTAVLDQDHELAAPPRNQPPAPVPAGQTAPKVGQPETTRKTVDQLPVAPSSVAVTALEPAVQAPVLPENDPPKLENLDPIAGGTAAIKSKYIGSTYADRRTRADLLELALDANSNGGKGAADAYQALKDELIWLRENMGTPPPAPK